MHRKINGMTRITTRWGKNLSTKQNIANGIFAEIQYW